MLCECIFCLLRRFAEFFFCSTALDVEPPFQCRLNVSVVLGGDGRTAVEFDGGWRKLQSLLLQRGGLAKNIHGLHSLWENSCRVEVPESIG